MSKNLSKKQLDVYFGKLDVSIIKHTAKNYAEETTFDEIQESGDLSLMMRSSGRQE